MKKESEIITVDDCKIDNKGFISCKGIPLNNTGETLIDFEWHTGFDRMELIKSLYFGSLAYRRNKKLEELLND